MSRCLTSTCHTLEYAGDRISRILPPIDENDPEWQAYVRRKVRESLADPRPSIPAEEAFARLDARIAEYKAKRGL